MFETSFLTRKINTHKKKTHSKRSPLGSCREVSWRQRSHLETDLSLVRRTESSLVDYCGLGDKLGSCTQSPSVGMDIALWRAQGVVQSSEAPSTTPAAEEVTGAAGSPAGS